MHLIIVAAYLLFFLLILGNIIYSFLYLSATKKAKEHIGISPPHHLAERLFKINLILSIITIFIIIFALLAEK